MTGGQREVAVRGLGDVDRQVADPFEVAVDLQRRHDHAQVRRHRLVQREQPERQAVDRDVQLVDRLVALQDAVQPVPVAGHERVHRDLDAVLGQPAHRQDRLLEVVEFLLEVPEPLLRVHLRSSARVALPPGAAGPVRPVYPKRPVT